jgi:hypothetical protein
VIIINGVAIMGGVDVKRKPTIEQAREARQLRRDTRRDRLDGRRDYHQDRRELHRERRDARRYGELD